MVNFPLGNDVQMRTIVTPAQAPNKSLLIRVLRVRPSFVVGEAHFCRLEPELSANNQVHKEKEEKGVFFFN